MEVRGPTIPELNEAVRQTIRRGEARDLWERGRTDVEYDEKSKEFVVVLFLHS